MLGNKDNFFNLKKVGAEYAEIYTSMVKEVLLSYGFLLLEEVGYSLL